MAKITVDEFQKLMADELPWAAENGMRLHRIEHGKATMILPFSGNMLRPGGTVSGPALMTTADCALYVAILSELGPVKLAVTTSLTINFLRRPSADCDVIGQCRLMKIGKRLVVGEVYLYSEGHEDPVAHVVGTYSVPPRNK